MPDPVVRVIVYDARFPELTHQQTWRHGMDRVGREVADEARRGAPHRSGEMARSISHELVEDPGGLRIHVSWDVEHYYGLFHEVGTAHVPERRFLRDAAERTYEI